MKNPLILLVLSVVAILASCGAESPESSDSIQDPLFFHHRPKVFHPRRLPPLQCRGVCRVRGAECGSITVGHRVFDCGDCADGETCEGGRCVSAPDACTPDGSTTSTCDNDTQTTFDSCGNVISEEVCHFGCLRDACDQKICGNGVREVGELCDDGNDVNEDSCTNECRPAACGDEIVFAGVEECDDGNDVIGDGCGIDPNSVLCSPEQREDGTCACLFPGCGDGVVDTDAGEECDDGNGVEDDKCTNACTLPICGDGIVQSANKEECDDGNDASDDLCFKCRSTFCGDGVVQSARGEECDDQNKVDDDGCTNECLLPVCGNGIVQSGEECDDGNNVNDDDCTNVCTNPVCGDGIVQVGNDEECDEPGVTWTSCNDECHIMLHYVFVTSQVYDGNLGGIDGADATCQAHADAAGLPGTYSAWLWVSWANPPTRLPNTPGAYVLPSGTIIANRWVDFALIGSLLAPIMETETGGAPPAGTTSCSSTLVTPWVGTAGDATCGDWTSNSASMGSVWGQANSTTLSWMNWCQGGTCSARAPLYCVQQ